MRRRNRTPRFSRFLPMLLCAAALAVGGTAGVLLGVRPEAPALSPLQPPSAPPAQTAPTLGPILPDTPPVRETGAERGRAAPSKADIAQGLRSPSSNAKGTQGHSVPQRPHPQRLPADLSAYRPKARSAEGEGYLPQDRSLSAAQLKGQLTAPAASDDEGHGFFDDVVRGTRRILKSVDDTTLDASQRAFGSIARPESAKIRPYGDGARLHIDIPAHTVDLKRKKK